MDHEDLLQAAADGDVGAVKSLIVQRADVNAADEDGETALGKAMASGFDDVVHALLASGAKMGR